jgi:hypothetical protein
VVRGLHPGWVWPWSRRRRRAQRPRRPRRPPARCTRVSARFGRTGGSDVARGGGVPSPVENDNQCATRRGSRTPSTPARCAPSFAPPPLCRWRGAISRPRNSPERALVASLGGLPPREHGFSRQLRRGLAAAETSQHAHVRCTDARRRGGPAVVRCAATGPRGTAVAKERGTGEQKAEE